jgi:hypothetical protein
MCVNLSNRLNTLIFNMLHPYFRRQAVLFQVRTIRQGADCDAAKRSSGIWRWKYYSVKQIFTIVIAMADCSTATMQYFIDRVLTPCYPSRGRPGLAYVSRHSNWS